MSSITRLASNELYYKIKILNTISLLLSDLSISIKIFNKLRLIKRKEVDDAIVFTFTFIKIRYDVKYLTLNLKKNDKAFLRLYYNYLILDLFNYKLS